MEWPTYDTSLDITKGRSAAADPDSGAVGQRGDLVDARTFTCPDCGATSPDRNDVLERYCARCHWWTGDPVLGRVRPGGNRVAP